MADTFLRSRANVAAEIAETDNNESLDNFLIEQSLSFLLHLLHNG